MTSQKVALVTGSSSGMGFETSLALARNGIYTYATMRKLDGSSQMADIAKNENLPLEIIQLDVKSVADAIDRILIEAGRMVNSDNWISSGEILMTTLSNFEQKYQNIIAISGIINPVEVDSLPRNESGFYIIGFGVAGVLMTAGVLIQLLSKKKITKPVWIVIT